MNGELGWGVREEVEGISEKSLPAPVGSLSAELARCGQKQPGPGALLGSVLTWELPGGAWPGLRGHHGSEVLWLETHLTAPLTADEQLLS